MDRNKIQSFLFTHELPKSARLSTASLCLGNSSATAGSSPTIAAPHPSKPPAAAQLSAWIPYMVALKSLILQELESKLHELLKLNPTRREAVVHYLDRLAGHGSSQQGPQNHPSSPHDWVGGLQRWLEGPRSPAQNTALQCYFEEIAILVLGRSILLKSWSDRSMRVWSPNDLCDLNWAMNSALKPHIPLDRDNWQVARQNIYSWYNPSATLQREIWMTLDPWRIPAENPSFLAVLLSSIRNVRAEAPEPEGYDSKFYQSLWENMKVFGFDPENTCPPYRQAWHVFCPTLRDGGIVRTGPESITWIGLDSSPFLVMMAELLQLWRGLSSPPLWAIGNGLEVPTRDQLMLNLGVNRAGPKPSLFSRIAEMEACDASFVFEERCVRGQGRSGEAHSFRDQADGIPYFRKLRSSGTSLGDLQACVALSKLRPGGLLWWTREEPLDSRAGHEVLNLLLERAKLIAEWNLAEIEHGLPAVKPLFPRYIYLFQRENRFEEVLSHRPLRIHARGTLRSHVEIPQLLDDALKIARGPITPHDQWVIQAQQSPIPQKEWADRWPEPAAQSILSRLESLREASHPLASASTIRPTPTPEVITGRGGQTWSVDHALTGFWIRQPEERKLLAQPLPKPGEQASGSGFMILLTDENAVAPLRNYLESEIVGQWLDQQCERKGDRWIINEQIVRWIPVPKLLLRSLGLATDGLARAQPLTAEWERIAVQLTTEPKSAREALRRAKLALDFSSTENATAVAEIFTRASRALERLRSEQNSAMTLIDGEGRIRWRDLLECLSKSECVSFALHPRVVIQGSMPPHLPIGQIQAIKTPATGFMLISEAGFSTKILSDSQIIRDMLGSQLKGLSNPTWSELTHYIKLPRRLELAEETANDVLKMHAEKAQRASELVQILSDCALF